MHKEVYEYTPNGLRLIKYEPKRIWHFHLVEVLIIFGLGALIGIIGSEYVITRFAPKAPCPQYVCQHGKIKLK